MPPRVLAPTDSRTMRLIDGIERAQARSRSALTLAADEALDAYGTDEVAALARRAAREGDADVLVNSRAWVRASEAAERALSAPYVVRASDPPVVQTYLAGVQVGIETAPLSLAAVDLDPVSDAAAAWAAEQAAQLVTVVDASTKAGIREVVSSAFANPDSHRGAQRALLALVDDRGRPRIGLTERQARGFDRYLRTQMALTDAGDITPKQMFRSLDLRFAAYRRSRVKLIGHTESLAAGNQGLLDSWGAAADQGHLDRDVYIQEWVVRLINVCPRCEAMAWATAEIGGIFVSDGSGPKGVEQAQRPELHPGGYCTLRLIRRQDAKRLPVAA